MDHKIFMVLGILFVFILFQNTNGMLTIKEQETLKHIFRWNWDIILHLLQTNFPNINSNNFITEIQFWKPEITHISYAPLKNHIVDLKNNGIEFWYLDDAMTFHLQFYWIYDLGLLPFSGTAEAVIKVKNLIYAVDFAHAEADAKISRSEWEIVQLETYNNFIAKLFGIDAVLKKELSEKWKTTVMPHIEKQILPQLNEYFKIRYPVQKNMMFAYFDYHHSITIHEKLMDIKITEDGSLECLYESRAEKIPNESQIISYKNDSSYGMRHQVNAALFGFLLNNIFTAFYPRFTFTNSMIPPEKRFALTGREFMQVVPDFYMMNGDVPIILNITASVGNMEWKAISDEIVEIRAWEFDIDFMYNNENIVSAKIQIGGHFTPHIEIQRGSNSGMVNFKIIKLWPKIREITHYKYTTVLKTGLENYLNLGLNEWLKPLLQDEMLGNGLYIEAPFVLDAEKTYCKVDNDLLITFLNPAY